MLMFNYLVFEMASSTAHGYAIEGLSRHSHYRPESNYPGASHNPMAQLSRGGSWMRHTANRRTPGPWPGEGMRHRSHSRSQPS